MPRFYFDISDGEFLPDADGAELRDLQAAQHEAFSVVSQIIPLREKHLEQGDSLTLTVSDADHMVLFTIDVATTFSPAVKGSKSSG